MVEDVVELAEGHRQEGEDLELLDPVRVGEAGELRREDGVTAGQDAVELQRLALAAGMRTIFDQAVAAAGAGRTDPAEIRRVLGFGS